MKSLTKRIFIMLICVIIGCNKTIPVIYDVIDEKDLAELAASLNSGKIPEFDTDGGYISCKDSIFYLEDAPISDTNPGDIRFTMDSLSYKPEKFNCTLLKPQLICMTKGSRKVVEVYEEICNTYWV